MVYYIICASVSTDRVKGKEIRMNEKKIAFIICTNSDIWYSECVQYLARLDLPEGFEAEVMQIVGAKSMTAGYNEGMQGSDAKYKFYLHHDLFITNKDFLKKVIDVFVRHPEIGIMGLMGTNRIVTDACYWNHWDMGQVYALDAMQPFKVCGQNTPKEEVSEVMALDGMLLMTQYDLEWREDIFHGWDFYDISQCFEFIKQGYQVAVLNEQNISCIHDCGFSKLARYDASREAFCREYADFGFVYEKQEDELQAEREKLLGDFLQGLNGIFKVNLGEAAMLVEETYKHYPKDNRMAVLKIISEICQKEKQSLGMPVFAKPGDTWEELIEKYTIYKFLIRRVELGIRDEAARELFMELQMGNISLDAIEEIICHCCYNGATVIYKLQEELAKCQ